MAETAVQAAFPPLAMWPTSARNSDKNELADPMAKYPGVAACADEGVSSESEGEELRACDTLAAHTGLLRERGDGCLEFEHAVRGLLAAYMRNENCLSVLAALPQYSCEVADAKWSELRWRLRVGAAMYQETALLPEEAVRVSMPLRRTCFLPLAVLFEAWSRCTGMPAVFYMDAFVALWSSLLPKDMAVHAQGFSSRQRFWACGTAEAGSG